MINQSGPSCLKLTMSLVNDSLKLHQVIRKYAEMLSEYCVLDPLEQLTKWPLTSSLS